MCHAGGGRVLTNTELLESWQRMNQTQRTGVELGFTIAYTVVTYGAAGGFAVQRLTQAEQSLERTTVDEEFLALTMQRTSRHLTYVPGPDDLPSPTWVKMGTNDAGSVIMGTTRMIGEADVESAIDSYGPGIILTGRHGGIYPYGKLSRFFTDDLVLVQIYSGQVQVVNFNLVTQQQLTNMGRRGQTIYAAWCNSADCEILLGLLH